MHYENYDIDHEAAVEEGDQDEQCLANLWEQSYADMTEKSVEATKQQKELTAEEWKKREEAVFANPKVKEFMANYEQVLKTGKLDENFLKSARELGKRCMEDYDTFYFLWHKLNQKGVTIAADDKGITFTRIEYLGGRDSLGHPAIPYGQTIVNLTIPYDGSKLKGSATTHYMGSRFDRDWTPEPITDAKAAQRIFKPVSEPVSEDKEILKK